MIWADVIDELIKAGQEVEAVYFVHESGLSEHYPPDSLLKSYLETSKKKVNSESKEVNSSSASKVCYTLLLFNTMLSEILLTP